MERLARKDVVDAAFDIVLRGYDKRQVDERIRFLVTELSSAHNALAAAAQRVAVLEDALSQPRTGPGGAPAGDANFGARVEKILTLAQDEAREVRSQAESAAAALVDQARTQAEELFHAATADAEQVRQAARGEADQIVSQACTEADRRLAAATDAAAQRERTSAHELHQLSRLQEEINADLYRVKDVLESLFGPGGAVAGPILGRRRKDGAQPAQPARTV